MELETVECEFCKRKFNTPFPKNDAYWLRHFAAAAIPCASWAKGVNCEEQVVKIAQRMLAEIKHVESQKK